MANNWVTGDPRTRRILAEQVAALKDWGAEAELTSMASLLRHLLGTREVLRSWGCSSALCTAGLFHSVYGTESFWKALRKLDAREEVRSVCGWEAEEIVYLYSTMTRSSFESSLRPGGGRRVLDDHADIWRLLPARRHHELCLLSTASWLEQVPRLSPLYREIGRERAGLLLPHLSGPAGDALRAVYADA